MLNYAYSPNTQEAEAGGLSQLQGQPGLHHICKASQGMRVTMTPVERKRLGEEEDKLALCVCVLCTLKPRGEFFFFFKISFLCSPCYPGTHSVDQAGLELRGPPASASQVLGLKLCATTPG